MQTGIKHKPNIEIKASQSQAKLLSFCLHNVPTWAPGITSQNLLLIGSFWGAYSME